MKYLPIGFNELYSKLIKAENTSETKEISTRLMAAASCQYFYDEMYSEYNIDRIDLMKDITSNNLSLWTEEFDNAMQKYKKNYDRLGAEIKQYTDLEEFERGYLE